MPVGIDDLLPAWLRAGTHAAECMRQGCLPEAVQAFDVALLAIASIPEPDRGELSAERRRLLVGQAECLVRLGQLAQAREALLAAYPDVEQARSAGAAPDICEGQARMWLATMLLWQGRPSELDAAMRQALLALPAEQGVGTRAAEVRARMLEMLAVGQGACGQAEAALALHAQALAVFEHPLHADLARERGTALINAGVEHWHLGELANARACLIRAIAVFEGLVAGGRAQESVNICAANMNLGCVLLAEQAHGPAIERLQRAVQGYEELLRRPVSGNAYRWRASRALSKMNLGYALFTIGDWPAASQQYRDARRAFAMLARERPRLRNDEANNWVNEAHLLARQGQPGAAQRLYHRAWRLLDSLSQGSHPELIPDAANARLGLARVQAQRGRFLAAARNFSAGQAALVALASQGQIRFARAWLLAVADHADALLSTAVGVVVPISAGRELLAALAAPPCVGTQALEPALRDIGDGLQRLANWSNRGQQSAAAWWPAFGTAFLSYLLDRMALVLGDSDPQELRQHATVCAALVEGLREAACQQHHAPIMVADWFLRTRGLRAQRSALAVGRSSAMADLRDMLARLRRLELDMLSQPGSPLQPSGVSRPGSLPEAGRWRALHDECAARRRTLVKAGLLPHALRLDVVTMLARLPQRGALLMLARAGRGQLLALALFRTRGGLPSVLARLVGLDADTAALSATEVLRDWRQATWSGDQSLRRGPDTESLLAGVAAAPDQPGTEKALRRLHEQVASRALQPLIESLKERGLNEFALVPSADLHLLPYHHLLGPTLRNFGARLSVWPSCGALAQHGLQGRSGRRVPVWALAAYAALQGSAPLQWVEFERSLALRLWGKDRVKLLGAHQSRARGIDALLGIGHGCALPLPSAEAGLLSGEGHVLGAHDLPAVRTCHHVILSCCVLGQVQEVHTEAMGFLSTSFGYRTRFGVGWLIEIPDAEASLFSLAFQYALHGVLHVPSRRQPRWLDVFESVRHDIAQGRWPAGFGPWLGEHMPRVVAECALHPGPWLNRYEYLRDFDGGMFCAPPPSLRKFMPWVVALGC